MLGVTLKRSCCAFWNASRSTLLHRELSTPSYELGAIASHRTIIDRALRERRTDDAFRSFLELRKRAVFPSSEAISTLLAQLAYKESPTSLSQADNLVNELIVMGRKDLLDQNSLSLLVLAYARAMMPTFARSTLKLMIDTGHLPSAKVWSAVISKMAENVKEAPAALELFHEICRLVCPAEKPNKTPKEDSDDPVARIIRLMDRVVPVAVQEPQMLLAQMRPDVMAFNSALKICVTLGAVESAEELLKQMSMVYGISPDTTSFDTLIAVYGKAGRTDSLKQIPERMAAAEIQPSGETLKALVCAYAEAGVIEEAEKLVVCLQKAAATSEFDDLDERWKSLRWTKLNPDIYTLILRIYVEQRRLDDAGRLLMSLHSDDILGNGITHSSVVWSMVASGLLTEAHAIVQHMALKKMRIGKGAYTCLVKGFASINRLDSAAGVILLMKKAGMLPDVTCYTPLIMGLLRCGDRILAYETFMEMMESKIEADEYLYMSLLQALAVENRALLMLKVIEAVIQDERCRVRDVAFDLVLEHISKRGMSLEAKKLLVRMERYGVRPTSYSFWYVVKCLITKNRPLCILEMWPQIERSITKDDEGNRKLELHKEFVDTLLYAFVKGAYFKHALKLVRYADEVEIGIDREAFRDLFIKYHSYRFTSKHKCEARVNRRRQQVLEMEEFKEYIMLPLLKNSIYKTPKLAAKKKTLLEDLW